MDEIAKLVEAARNKRLVIFVGAGVSMTPPTNLPSWRDVNRIVVRSLASTARKMVGEPDAEHAAQLILARHEHEKLPPEYQAQVLAELLYEDYFEVLRHLDSDRPNATHLALAWLARLGCVRAIITTNFDRLVEAAFAAVGEPLERHFQPEHFRALAADLGRFEERGRACQLLKLHGSVDDPRTLIDTLAQRKKGFASPVLSCTRHLLRSGHWLFLGFSGLDLEAEPNYLGIAQEADTAIGFTWFVREKTEPKPAVVRLRQRYGERGEFVYGNLPGWLLDLTARISPEPGSWIEQHLEQDAASSSGPTTPTLEQSAHAWAARLSPTLCAMSLALLVFACAEPQAAAKLVEGILRKLDESEPQSKTPTPELLLARALAGNALGVLLAGLGRHEEAVRWISAAVEHAEQAGDDDARDRMRGNLGMSLEVLGRVDEAAHMYRSALASYRARADPALLAFGLTSLASRSVGRSRCVREDRRRRAHARDSAVRSGHHRQARG